MITREDGYTPILPSFVHRVEKEQIFVGFFDEENKFKDSLTIPLINFVEPQDNWYVLATFEDNENAEGEYYNIDSAFYGEITVEIEECKNDQGNVYDHGKITDVDSRNVLYHGAYSVNARRRKAVGEYEYCVIESGDNC